MLRQRDGGRAWSRGSRRSSTSRSRRCWAKTRLCGTTGAARHPLLQRLALPADPGHRRGRHRDGAADHGAPRGLPRRDGRAHRRTRVPARRWTPTPRTCSATSARSPTRSWPSGGRRRARATQRDRAAAHRPDRARRARAAVRRRPARHARACRRWRSTTRAGSAASLSETRPDAGQPPGHHASTRKVQAVAEKQLRAAIKRARTTGDINKGGKQLKADSGAVVVMDVRTGGIVAMASWPTYDPNIWVGGISTKDYKAITSKKSNYPNQSRATQGEFAPASTFKAVSLPAAVKAGYSVHRSYSCPAAYSIGGDHEAQLRVAGATASSRCGAPSRSPATPSSTSSPTRPGCGWAGCTRRRAPRTRSPRWPRASVSASRPASTCRARRTAGSPTGPGSGPTGRRPGSSTARRRRPATRRCADRPGARGLPAQLSKENCVDGWAYRGGDAANFAIGQGDTTTTPLQMARVYAAVANGGTLVTPHIGKAIIDRRGQAGPPDRAEGRRPGAGRAGRRCAWLRAALRGVTEQGTGCGPFFRAGVPADEGAGRLQDRHRRGLRQADDVVVRVLRAGRQAAVRRRDDGVPGRHRLGHLRARRWPRSTRRCSASAGRRSTWPRRSRPAATRRPRCPRSGPTAPSCSRSAGAQPAAGCRPSAARTGRRGRGRGVGYAGAYTVPPPRRGSRLLRRDSRCAGSTGRCCSPCSRCARSGPRWSGRRPGRRRSTPAPTRRRSSRGTCSTSRIGLVLGVVASLFDYRMLRAYAPVVYVLSIVGLVAVLSPLGSTINGVALLDRAAGRLLGAAVGVREGRAGRGHGDAARRRSATREDAPRDVDVVLGARRSPPCRWRWSCCSPTSAPRW